MDFNSYNVYVLGKQLNGIKTEKRKVVKQIFKYFFGFIFGIIGSYYLSGSFLLYMRSGEKELAIGPGIGTICFLLFSLLSFINFIVGFVEYIKILLKRRNLKKDIKKHKMKD